MLWLSDPLVSFHPTRSTRVPMRTRSRGLRRILPLLAVALAAGCGDLGVDVGGTDVAQVAVVDAQGTTLATADENLVSGAVTVARNGQRALGIRLRDASGGSVGLGLGESVRVAIVNTQVAQWSGGADGTLSGGPVAATTTMRIDVLRGGTLLFSSAAIPVQVL